MQSPEVVIHQCLFHGCCQTRCDHQITWYPNSHDTPDFEPMVYSGWGGYAEGRNWAPTVLDTDLRLW
jgi:hypothetical protein